jgi:predicted metalloprotease with PDZ domain
MTQAPIAYQVQVLNKHAHLFQITLTIANPAVNQRVNLPVWIPGSYLVREFSKNLQQLHAQQGESNLAIVQLDKCSWELKCQADQAVTLHYEVYALDASVRTAWLDERRGFFNGTSLCLQVAGQENVRHELTLRPDVALPHWQVATSLTPKRIFETGFGSYTAENYDELVDSPVEMGSFWSGSFVAGGIPHRFVVAGAPASFDGRKLLADTQAICETEIKFWHGDLSSNCKPQHTHYLFMLNAVSDGYGGLEHRNSTALICNRADLPRLSVAQQPDGYTTLLGLISHEYFHTWNVKQLRPKEFRSYDYSRENYTQLLWFFEGFTSYFDDLLLRHAGLINDTCYLQLVSKTINQVHQTPGRLVQSVAQASLDAWVKYYRQDENTPNATVSYYTKGSLVAMCLDLTLRQEGKTNLGKVMRGLWQRCQGGVMTQDDLLAVLFELSGRSFAAEIAQWVHGTTDLPLTPLLARQGVRINEDMAPIAQQLGLRVSETHAVQVKSVLRGSAAEKAGFAAGDEWFGVDIEHGKTVQSWRINKLDDLPLYSASASHVVALIARDQRLMRLDLDLPIGEHTLKLSIDDPARVTQWLQP